MDNIIIYPQPGPQTKFLSTNERALSAEELND
jgi:hypothetical protein